MTTTTTTTAAYAAQSPTDKLSPFEIQRRSVGPTDVKIKILFCGVCHSDIHMTRNEWSSESIYPMVPGHEIIGKVVEVGSDVKGLSLQQTVAVGCLVDSCRKCSSCGEGLEQYCEGGMVLTYGSPDEKHGGVTYGGYSTEIIVDQDFVLKVPENLDLAGAAPLLCAGITMWSPLKHWKVGKGTSLGIIGLGGLGHMGVKLGAALGAEVTMITTSEEKCRDATKLGAHHVLLSKDPTAMKKALNSFDVIINTIPVGHDMNPYISLLKRDGTMVLVGALEPLKPGLDGGPMIFGRKSIAGSLIGGIKETQEMLDFCGKHDITSDVEVINIKDINEAYERTLKGDVKYRFVIDIASLRPEAK